MKTELLLANSFLGRKMKLKQILYKTCSPEKEKKNFYFFLSAIRKVWIVEMAQQIRALVALAKDKGLFSNTHIEAPVLAHKNAVILMK